MPSVTLREIGPDIEDAVRALRVAPGQEGFVASVEQSFVDAVDEPEGNAWMRAVLADGIPAGFVMVAWDVVPVPGEMWGPYYLWRLLVDARYQGRGIGAAAVALVAEAVRADGADTLLTSCVPGEGSPQPFYEGLGFVPTGELDPDGEVILALDLATGPTR
ncbi:GNAT family N-acetyltransferase [Fodinibacter luteus]|uniref:GNAT family N-acetyltransferase n=1 Tax=Fodinibacter luteus TaxID=552064 RepID=A0ABP8KQQ7_9MICO